MLIFIVIGFSILSVFLLFVLVKKNKQRSDFHLIALILFFIGIFVSQAVMTRVPTRLSYITVLFFNSFYFPVLVNYGLSLVFSSHQKMKNWLWIYAWPIIYFSLLVYYAFVHQDAESFALIEGEFQPPSRFQLVLYLCQYAYMIIFLIWLWLLVQDYSIRLKSYYSYVEKINLKWFHHFILGFLSINVFSVICFVCYIFDIIDSFEIYLGVLYLVFILLLFYLCFQGIRQYSIEDFAQLSTHSKDIEADTKDNQANIKYGSSKLDEQSIDLHFESIKSEFEKEELFLESKLKLEDIAKRMSLSTHYVSQIINTKSTGSFFDFVNKYRVEYFKDLLSDTNNDQYTILALGLQSGFNSKSSMNRVFKKEVGLSPREFQKASRIGSFS